MCCKTDCDAASILALGGNFEPAAVLAALQTYDRSIEAVKPDAILNVSFASGRCEDCSIVYCQNLANLASLAKPCLGTAGCCSWGHRTHLWTLTDT